MNEEEIEILQSVFNKYDTDQRGYLTPHQFTLLISRLGRYIKELRGVEFSTAQAVFGLLDTDGDKRISFDDFVGWWRSEDEDSQRYSYFIGEKGKLLRKAYGLYSSYVSETGNMTYLQFNNMMDELGLEHDEYTFDLLDVNDDGLLSFSEFLQWLNWF